MIIDKTLNIIIKTLNLLVNLMGWLVRHWVWVIVSIIILYIIVIKLFKRKQEQEEPEEEIKQEEPEEDEKLKKKLEELRFEKGNLQIELDKVYNPQSSEYKEGGRMSDEKFTNIHNRITEIDAIINFCEGRVLNEDWRDLPEKDEKEKKD